MFVKVEMEIYWTLETISNDGTIRRWNVYDQNKLPDMIQMLRKQGYKNCNFSEVKRIGFQEISREKSTIQL